MAEAPAPKAKTQETILLLGVAGFCSIALVRACDALVPAFAREFDVSIVEAAMPVLAYAFAYGAGQLVYGPIGSRMGPFRLATIGCAVTALLTLMCAFASTLDQLVMARIAAGLAAGSIIPMGTAFIGETVAYEERQSTIARYLSGAIIGSIFGFTLSGLFAEYLDWRWVFMTFGIGLAATAVGLWRCWLKLPLRGAQATKPPRFSKQYAAIMLRRWPVTILTLAALLGGFAFGVIPLIAMTLSQSYGMSEFQIGIVLGALGVGALIYTLVSQRIVKRFGELGSARWGAGIAAASFLLMCVPWGPMPIVIGCFGSGFGYMMLNSALQVNATQMSPDNRPVAMSLFAASIFIGQAAGVAVYSLIGPVIGFVAAALLSALGILGVGFIFAVAKTRHIARTQASTI